MKKKIGYTLLVLLVIMLIGSAIGVRKFNKAFFTVKPNILQYTYDSNPIHFDWAKDSIGGFLETQAAMMIPIQIAELSHRFYMQFDTGSPDTYIYERDLQSLRDMGVTLKEIENEHGRFIERIDFTLGKNHIQASMLKILSNYGHTFSASDSLKSFAIGTIGSDFLANRITSIDFKKQEIQFYNERPSWMNNRTGFQPFDFTARRIMLPVTLNNKQYEFLYDSGCSAFGLITTKNRFDRYTESTTEAITYDAKSWNSSINISSKFSEQRFIVGNSDLSLKRVSHVDMYTWLQPLVTPFTRIGGWMGNQPFAESILILDTKAEEYLVITD